MGRKVPRPCFVGLQRWEPSNGFARIPVNPGDASLEGADPDGTAARAAGRCGQSTKLGDVSPAALIDSPAALIPGHSLQ